MKGFGLLNELFYFPDPLLLIGSGRIDRRLLRSWPLIYEQQLPRGRCPGRSGSPPIWRCRRCRPPSPRGREPCRPGGEARTSRERSCPASVTPTEKPCGYGMHRLMSPTWVERSSGQRSWRVAPIAAETSASSRSWKLRPVLHHFLRRGQASANKCYCELSQRFARSMEALVLSRP